MMLFKPKKLKSELFEGICFAGPPLVLLSNPLNRLQIGDAAKSDLAARISMASIAITNDGAPAEAIAEEIDLRRSMFAGVTNIDDELMMGVGLNSLWLLTEAVMGVGGQQAVRIAKELKIGQNSSADLLLKCFVVGFSKAVESLKRANCDSSKAIDVKKLFLNEFSLDTPEFYDPKLEYFKDIIDLPLSVNPSTHDENLCMCFTGFVSDINNVK